MKIKNILHNGKLNLSFEVFPPKEWKKFEDTISVVDSMAELNPSFISVTYGAAGGTKKFTEDIALHIKNKCKTAALAHLTCVGADKDTAENILNNLRDGGVENVLALRGDIPQSGLYQTDFLHASDLVSFIKNKYDFCVGGACYPEGHPDAVSIDKDIDALKIKEDCGVDFFTTQMFFDNNVFYCFLNKMYQKGIKTPVITGIMPIVNAGQLARVSSLGSTTITPRFRAIVEKFGSDPASMLQAGIIYATEQIIDLYANGVQNVHLYTMNKPYVAKAICSNISEIIK